MGMFDQVVRQTTAPQGDVATDGFGEIEAAVEAARAGRLSEDDAFEAIARVVRRRSADAEVYQKPWG
jgi:Rod binding domain-containing protein